MNITAKENKIKKIARSIPYKHEESQTICKTPNQSKIAHHGVSIENRKNPHCSTYEVEETNLKTS
jgi:hypothetical protein